MQKVTASVVREWAVDQNLAKVGKGRLAVSVIEKFNETHKTKVHESGFKAESVVSLTVPFVNKAGANRTKIVKIPAAKLRALDGSEGKRGRIKNATKMLGLANLSK